MAVQIKSQKVCKMSKKIKLLYFPSFTLAKAFFFFLFFFLVIQL